MKIAEFAQLVGVHPLAIESWLHFDNLTEGMLTEKGVREFLSLKSDYRAVCCPYLELRQFCRAAGIWYGAYKKEGVIIYNPDDVLKSIPIHHTTSRSTFYSVKELRIWIDTHPKLSYIEVRGLLGVNPADMDSLFQAAGIQLPSDKMAQMFERKDIERIFRDKISAFSDGAIYGVSVEDKKGYTSFKSLERKGWTLDDLLRVCSASAKFYPELILDDDYYFSANTERKFIRSYSPGGDNVIVGTFNKKDYFSLSTLARYLGVSSSWLESMVNASIFNPDIKQGDEMYFSPFHVKSHKPGADSAGSLKYMFVGEVARYLSVTPDDVRAYGDYGLIPSRFVHDKIPLYLRSDVVKFSNS